MANNVDPDQTALIGAVCSWSTLFASILDSSDDFRRRHFQMRFFLGALRVKGDQVSASGPSGPLVLLICLALVQSSKHPDMTEKLLTWTSSINSKQKPS